MMNLKMIVAAINAMGEPDFYFCQVLCTEQDYDNGYHYDLAKEKAEENGYEPKMAMDENDAAGKAIIDHFVWKSASTYTVPSREHIFADCGGTPKCIICGADEDDAFVGGEECDPHCSCGSGLFNDKGECQKCGL